MNGRAAFAALVLVASGLLAATAGAPGAQAATGGTDSCSSTTSGGSSGGGGTVTSSGQITMWSELSQHSQSVLCPAGTSSGGGSNWTPPQCWWGPEFDPSGLATDIGQLGVGSSTDETYTAFTAEYASQGTGAPYSAGYTTTKGPPWELFNVPPATPQGEWWGLIWNDDITTQGINDCTAIDTKHFPEDWYWVVTPKDIPEPGDAPTLNSHELALYVEGKVKLQPLPIQTDPLLTATKATVGLPTWVWANAADTKLADQICTDAQYGAPICVNMTAQAQSFTVASSDSGATLYTTGCTLNADGTVGTAYTGQGGNPPCGVTFSQPGAWTLSLITTWTVTITYDGGALTDPAYTETDLNANVQEVQAINN